MQSIEIDFEVFKALTALRESEKDTYNDAVRKLLRLPRANGNGSRAVQSHIQANPNDWIRKGVTFPEGTELRASYKGETHYAKIEHGAIVLNGKRVTSPSIAAKLITNNSVNGWTFWECRRPGDAGWRLLKSLRSSR